jgi:hypothetical protein
MNALTKSNPIDLDELNAQLPADLMERFLNRFDPARVSANTFKESNDVMLFVHLPKTAGMSVGQSLQAAFDKFHGVNWRKIHQSFKVMTQRACYFRSHTVGRQVIMGHFGYNEITTWLQADLPVKAATIVRDPVARLISNFNYNSSDAHPAKAEFIKKYPTLESYAIDQPPDFQLYTLVGPTFSFEQALEKLIRNYTFLGVTEALAASLAHFSTSHGLPSLKEHRINTAAVDGKPQKASEEIVNLIRSKSHNDLRLHGLLKSLY